MEALDKKPVFKSADEVIHLMLESKKQSKMESQARYNTPEFQEILKMASLAPHFTVSFLT